eukprot:1268409-Pleurochrysis_carterae.AAC.1
MRATVHASAIECLLRACVCVLGRLRDSRAEPGHVGARTCERVRVRAACARVRARARAGVYVRGRGCGRGRGRSCACVRASVRARDQRLRAACCVLRAARVFHPSRR